MKCAEARELLSAYLDRTLSASECAELEEHLRLCPGCARELEELRQTVALIA
jgi:anti-sigma factor RsiW